MGAFAKAGESSMRVVRVGGGARGSARLTGRSCTCCRRRAQEAAFSRKYPSKPSCEWVHKTQKYRPPGATATYLVPLADMVRRGRGTGAERSCAHKQPSLVVAGNGRASGLLMMLFGRPRALARGLHLWQRDVM